MNDTLEIVGILVAIAAPAVVAMAGHKGGWASASILACFGAFLAVYGGVWIIGLGAWAAAWVAAALSWASGRRVRERAELLDVLRQKPPAAS